MMSLNIVVFQAEINYRTRQAQEYLKGYDHGKVQLTFWDGTKIAQMIDGLGIDD